MGTGLQRNMLQSFPGGTQGAAVRVCGLDRISDTQVASGQAVCPGPGCHAAFYLTQCGPMVEGISQAELQSGGVALTLAGAKVGDEKPPTNSPPPCLVWELPAFPHTPSLIYQDFLPANLPNASGI